MANAFAPVLDRIVDEIVEAINALNQFFAIITGASTWTRALKYEKAFEDGATSAGKALKRQLMGFDELNVLTAPGGGRAAEAEDFSKMFETMLVGSGSGIAFGIGEAIKNSDWEGVGAELVKGFNKVVGKIAATDELGAKIGKTINSAVRGAIMFFDNAEFYRLGKGIAGHISAAIENISPETFGHGLALKFNAVIDFAKGLFTTAWEKSTNAGAWLAEVINGWFSSIKWTDLKGAITTAINSLINAAKTFLNNLDWKRMGAELGKLLTGLLQDIDWYGLGETATGLITGVFDFIGEFLDNVDWQAVGDAIGDFLKGINWTKVVEKVMEVVWKAVKAGMKTLWGLVKGVLTDWDNQATFRTSTNVYQDYIGFAHGGNPERGSLFYAGEHGAAEIVSSRNGSTQVQNANQIAQSVASGNAGVVTAIATMTSILKDAIDNIPGAVVTLGDADVYRSAERGKQMAGRNLVAV